MATRAEQKALHLWTIWMVVLAIVLVWAAYLVREVLLLIYISGLLAIGFSPIVRWIERQRSLRIGVRRIPRWLAILALYLCIIGVVVGIGFLIVPPLVDQGQQLWSARRDVFDRAQAFLVEKGLLQQPISMQEAMARTPVSQGGEAVTTVFSAIAGVVGGIFGFVTILILTFYLLVESGELRASFLRLFPMRRRARVDAASRDITVKVSAWLGGQLFLGLVIGSTSALGLWLIGVPYFYVLALISGVGELIPVVGPVLAAIPAIAVASSISLKMVLLVVAFFFVQQQFENHVLVPKVMSRQVGVSAVTVIVSLLIGGRLLGILGAILAVPTAAILQVLFSEWTSRVESGVEGDD